MASYAYTIYDPVTGEYSEKPEDQGIAFEFPSGEAPETLEAHGKTFKKDFSFWGAGGQLSGCWPRACDASGVTEGSVKGFVQWGKKHGVDLEFDKQGRAVYRDKAHEKRCMAFRGFYHKNAADGQCTPDQTAVWRREFRERYPVYDDG